MRGSIFEKLTFICVKNNGHACITRFADRQEGVTDFAFREDMVVKTCVGEKELKSINSNGRTAISDGSQHGNFLTRPGWLPGGPGRSFVGKVLFGTSINKCILGIARA